MPLCRIQGLDLNTVLPQTVILGPHKIGPLSSEKVRHLGRELSNFEKLVFDFSVLYIQKKRGLRKKLIVSTLDIRIKQSDIKVSHSKVPSSENFSRA